MKAFFQTSIYNITIKCFGFILLLLLNVSLAQAQRFTATVDRNVVSPNEVITITYSLDADGEDFSAPRFNGLEILSGPNVSSSISVYNTRVMRNKTYSFLVRASKPGEINIPPAGITVNGKKLQSNSLKVTVQNGGSSGSVNPGQNQNTTAAPKGNAFGKDKVFLQLSTDKKEVYQGEAVVVSCKIFVRDVDLTEYQFLNPAFEGFWAEEVTLPKPTPISPVNINGKQYSVGEIRKVILYPQKNGTLKIGPLSIDCIGTKIISRSLFDDIFRDFSKDDFFNADEPIRAQISSNSLKINVKPLPEQSKPQSFTGFVGNAKIEAKLSNNKVKANEPVTLTVTVNGHGNFSTIQPFELKLETNAEIYTPETEEKLLNTGNDINGSKSFKYTIVPRNEGKLFIPPVKFSYFDPLQQKYFAEQTNAFTVTVEKGNPAPTPDQTQVDNYEPDTEENFWQKIPVWAWIGLGVLPVAAFLFFLLARNKKPKSKEPKHFSPKADMETKLAQKEDNIQELREAEEWLRRNNLPLFYASLLRAFTGWLQQKTNLPQAELSHENIRKSLVAQNTPVYETEHIITLLQKLEFIRYAPTSQQQEDASALLAELKHFLKY